MKKKLLTSKSGRVKSLSAKDMAEMRPAAEVLPKALLDVLPKRRRGERGPQKEPKKISVTVRYSEEVVTYFKSTGQGWQIRLDDILKGWVKRHKVALKQKKRA